MKKIISVFILSVALFALETIKPHKIIKFSYYISKITFNNKYIIAGLENGKIEIKDLNSLKILHQITLPKIHDFMGDLIAMPIYSLDILNNKLLILAEGENASRILYIYNLKTKKLTKIFQTPKTLMQAKFVDSNRIIFAYLSDEIALYNLKTKKWEYDNQIGEYVFSVFALNPSKTKIALGDESGNLKIADVNTGKKIKEIIGYNKDKTIALSFQKHLILNASVDKRIGIYDLNGNTKLTLESKFIPYAAALSPDEKIFAFEYDEKNNIMVKDLNNKALYLLKGHTMTLNDLEFLNNSTIISFSPAEIIIWKIKE
ncbi:nitrate reductase [Caminibacter sp.]